MLVALTVVTFVLGELLLLSELLITGRGLGSGLVIFVGGFFATGAFDLIAGVAGAFASHSFRFTATFLRPPIFLKNFKC